MRGVILFLWVICAVIFSGCRVSEREGPEVPEEINGEGLTAGFCENDAEKFLYPLTSGIRKEFGTKEFKESRERICRRMGTPVKKEYAGKLRHPFLDIDLWRITFERSGDGGKKIIQEALFQVVSVKEGGKSKVISFGFL